MRKAKEIRFIDGPQAYSRHYVEPKDGITQTFHLHLEEAGPGGRGRKKHGHVNEAAFYILDGSGYEIYDGIRYDWQAGDVVVVPNNCVHQHFNGDPHRPARALVIKTKPMYLFMNMLFQKQVEPRPDRAHAGRRGLRGARGGRGPQPPEGGLLRMAWGETTAWLEGGLNEDHYQQLLDDAAVAPVRNARRRKIITPAEMPWEMARQGILKHLLNERMNTRMTVDAYMQIIPPGSRLAGIATWPRNASTCSRARATICTRTARSRSPTTTTGSRRTRSGGSSGRRAT